jgi:hypothetical protein
MSQQFPLLTLCCIAHWTTTWFFNTLRPETLSVHHLVPNTLFCRKSKQCLGIGSLGHKGSSGSPMTSALQPFRKFKEAERQAVPGTALAALARRFGNQGSSCSPHCVNTHLRQPAVDILLLVQQATDSGAGGPRALLMSHTLPFLTLCCMAPAYELPILRQPTFNQPW